MNNNRFIVLDQDHKLLTKALESDARYMALSEAEQQHIKSWLAGAEPVTASDFPNNVSRLYDVITLRDVQLRQNTRYKLVPPDESNEREGKLSAISPLGIRLMGLTEGESVVWQPGKKKKLYVVMEVSNAIYL